MFNLTVDMSMCDQNLYRDETHIDYCSNCNVQSNSFTLKSKKRGESLKVVCFLLMFQISPNSNKHIIADSTARCKCYEI